MQVCVCVCVNGTEESGSLIASAGLPTLKWPQPQGGKRFLTRGVREGAGPRTARKRYGRSGAAAAFWLKRRKKKRERDSQASSGRRLSQTFLLCLTHTHTHIHRTNELRVDRTGRRLLTSLPPRHPLPLLPLSALIEKTNGSFRAH